MTRPALLAASASSSLRNPNEGRQNRVNRKVARSDDGIDGGLAPNLFGRVVPEYWNDHHIHFHFLVHKLTLGLKPGEYCAHFHAPAIGPGLHNLNVSIMNKLKTLNADFRKSKKSMLVHIIDFAKRRKPAGFSILPSMVRLEPLHKGACTPMDIFKSSASLVRKFLRRGADRKLHAAIFFPVNLLGERERQIIEGRTEAMGRIPNSKAKARVWRGNGRDFHDVPPISVWLNDGMAEVAINKRFEDALSLSYVDSGSLDLMDYGREVSTHELWLSLKGRL